MPCEQERSLFLRRLAPGLLARGGTGAARLPKTMQFLIKLRSSGRTGIRCRRTGDRSHYVLSVTDSAVCLCVFQRGPGSN